MNLGDVALQKGQYELLKPYYEKALVLAQQIEAHEAEMVTLKGLSIYYQYKKDYEKARKYANLALEVSYRYNLRLERPKLFAHFSNLAYSSEDMRLGEYYATQSTLLEDSILNETVRKNTLELEKKYEAVITMDCDFSHEPEAIPSFLENLGQNDLVVGSRYTGGIRIMNWPMQRLLLSYFASIYARTITGIPFFDSTGGFNGYTNKALTSLKLDKVFSIGYAFQIELKYKVWSMGLPCKEIPITFFERTDGKSKMSRKIIFEAVINVFRFRIKKTLGTLN